MPENGAVVKSVAARTSLGSDRLGKPENSVDSGLTVRESRSQMPRTPNASKSIVIAFAARISLR
jgi:hypothetical protein